MSNSEKPKVPSSIPVPKARRGGTAGYFADVRRELAKVDWPTPRETTRMTGVVLAVCGLVTAALFALSFVCERLMMLIQKGSL